MVTGPHFCGYITKGYNIHLAERLSPLLVWRKLVPCCRDPHGRKLESASSQQPTKESNGTGESNGCKESNSSSNHVTLEVDPSLIKPWDETATPADTLVAAFRWDPETQNWQSMPTVLTQRNWGAELTGCCCQSLLVVILSHSKRTLIGISSTHRHTDPVCH